MENVHAKYIRNMQDQLNQTYHDLQDFLSEPEGSRKLIRSLLSIHDLVNFDQPDDWHDFLDYLNSQEPLID